MLMHRKYLANTFEFLIYLLLQSWNLHAPRVWFDD